MSYFTTGTASAGEFLDPDCRIEPKYYLQVPLLGTTFEVRIVLICTIESLTIKKQNIKASQQTGVPVILTGELLHPVVEQNK